MKKTVSALLILFSLLSLPATLLADDLDALLRQMIIGTWEEGNVPYGTVSFSPDGTYRAEMFSTKDQHNRLLRLEGTWVIKDSELHSNLTSSSSTKAPIGETFVDIIVQINRNELVLIGVDGQKYSKFRVQDETSAK